MVTYKVSAKDNMPRNKIQWRIKILAQVVDVISLVFGFGSGVENKGPALYFVAILT